MKRAVVSACMRARASTRAGAASTLATRTKLGACPKRRVSETARVRNGAPFWAPGTRGRSAAPCR